MADLGALHHYTSYSKAHLLVKDIDQNHAIVGFQRRRLIPAPLPDTSSLGKKAGTAGQWVDLPPMSGPMKEPFEIKVYEIDDVERLQRRRQEEAAEVKRKSLATCCI